jgi:hypothetical protein
VGTARNVDEKKTLFYFAAGSSYEMKYLVESDNSKSSTRIQSRPYIIHKQFFTYGERESGWNELKIGKIASWDF